MHGDGTDLGGKRSLPASWKVLSSARSSNIAPEQFEGKDADARADIWAFGAVLYEMATGQKAFRARATGVSLPAFFRRSPRRWPEPPLRFMN